MAKRINSLTASNAYGAGVKDGSQEALSMSLKNHWDSLEFQEKLSELRTLKGQAFEILA